MCVKVASHPIPSSRKVDANRIIMSPCSLGVDLVLRATMEEEGASSILRKGRDNPIELTLPLLIISS
jgi:hypothetical protein